MNKHFLDFSFKNTRSVAVTVILEPWAEEIVVRPSSEMFLKIGYTELGPLQTAYDERYFTVWLWSSCSAVVLIDGDDVTPRSLSITAPG